MSATSPKTGAVTLRDVAKAAGVTLATASRSLNNAYGVHPETRAQVLRAAEQMAYKPNRSARSLVTGRSNMIGLIVSDIRNPYFAEVARGVEDAGFAAGRDVMLCNSDLDSTKQMRYIESLLEKRVDGIIMNSVANLTRREQAYIADSGVPVVLLNRHGRGRPFSTVCADNESGGRMAAECLLQHGHRRLAHLTVTKNHANLGQRALGFQRTVESFGRGSRVLLLYGSQTMAGGHEMAMSFFRDRQGVTGIFAANDSMAFGVIRAAQEMGVRIPEDISLIGFDDVELASLVHPPLTTVRQPKYEMGAAAMKVLLRMTADGNKSYEHRVLGVELVERASVAKISLHGR